MNKNIFLIFLFFGLSILPGRCFSDTVIKADKEKVQGVVLENSSDLLRVMTKEGEMRINRSDVLEVEYAGREENLLSLIDIYLELDYPEKSYFLSQRILESDPMHPGALERLREVEELLKDRPPIERVASYERFSFEGHQDNDKSILLENAKVTESLYQNKGIALSSGSGGVYISYMARGAPVRERSLRQNDRIAQVEDVNADYLGLFDVAGLLASEEERRVVIRREMRLPSQAYTDTLARSSLKEVTGFSVKKVNDSCLVSEVDSASRVAARGLKKGDEIKRIEGEALTGDNCAERIKELFLGSPNTIGKIDMTIEREIIF